MKDEWIELQKEFPTVAFNWKSFSGKIQSPENGYKHIYIAEPWTLWKENWDVARLAQYETVITWNPAFYEQYRHVMNMHLVEGCLQCNAELNHLEEQEIPSWGDKKDAALILNTNYSLGGPGDLTWLRSEIANNLKYPVEIYSPKPDGWPADKYKGTDGSPLHHSHKTQLQLISKYRFCICFESSYHKFWTQGFMTERLFNCLKVRTIPIYMGNYSIQDYVPHDFYIDFRKYFAENLRDYNRLSDDLASMSESEFEETTEKARLWNKNHEIGSVSKLRKLLNSL